MRSEDAHTTMRLAIGPGTRHGDVPPLTRGDLDRMGLTLVGQEPGLPDGVLGGCGSVMTLSGPESAFGAFLAAEGWHAAEV